MPAAIVAFAAMLEHFDKSFLTLARGGIREGAILTMADKAEMEKTR